ncbi:protein PFF0380w-like isoform X2 [Odontomachus brunneus]|uniref:protein PFF0380w-like isoform X2 n=1 Tax=Odontomachus brunneus TaxID=486640 RepID=UPI0013F1E18C|nr:protein PFF0380w-like isoform X2 [Odontomachus brunneus]
MENSVTDKGIKSDLLSQSYSQGIGRVTGTKGSIVNFQIPKEVLENRIKTWNSLFDKYSEEMSDDIELNIETLEPEEEETEEFSEEEFNCGRVPMRKPATLVQYWINTDDKSNGTLSESKALEEHSFNEKQQVPISTDIAKKTVRKNVNLTSFHRKKLYTGRNSPVDLISIRKNSSDVDKPTSPDMKLSLHPALDPDNSIRNKSRIFKDKNKRNLFNKKTFGSKKVQTKRGQKSSVSSKNIGDEAVVTNNNTLDSLVDDSVQNLSSSLNEVDKRSSDNLIRDCNGTNALMKNTIQKYPVVYLERITSFKENKFKSVTNKDITQGNSVHSMQHSIALRRLRGNPIENVESADSDQSTIFICKCNNIASVGSSSVSSSFHLRLSTEDDCSGMSAEKKNDKLTNLKNVDTKQNKKALVILEQLSQSVIERYMKTTQALNMKDDLPNSSKKLPNKSKIHSSNSYRTNIKNDVKLREMKVILERLPADMYPKKSSNATNINFAAVTDKIVQDTSMNDNKRKSKNTIKNPNRENKRTARTIRKLNNNYSLRIHTRSKISDSEMNNMSNDIAQHNQISNGTGSNLKPRYGNHDSQNKHKKRSIFYFTSSDENDLVQFIQPSKKRLIDKTSKTGNIAGKDLYDEATLVSMNKNKYDSNKNINTTIYFSKKNNLRKIDGSIREKNRNKAEIKFSDSNATSTDPFSMRKHEKFSLFTHRSDRCNNPMKNLNGRREKFSDTENISNNSEIYLNKATKENRINHKNDACITLFQTKTFNIESSDSDQSNYDNTSVHESIRKSLRIASAHDKVQLNDHANKEKLYNNSHTKTHANKQLHPLNSFTRKYNGANKTHNAKQRLRSVIVTAETNERFDKEFNNNINLCTNTTTKAMPYVPVASNTRSTLMQKNNAILDSSLRNNSSNKLLRNKQIPENFSLKNSQANQEHGVESKVNKSLMFQTKIYYDSDSSEC